jgi:hypothetical protein
LAGKLAVRQGRVERPADYRRKGVILAIIPAGTGVFPPIGRRMVAPTGLAAVFFGGIP